jgi:hypothetical protein
MLTIFMMGVLQVNETVDIALQNSGVTVYRGHKITDVALSSHNFLQAVSLENKMFQGGHEKRNISTPRSDGGSDGAYDDDVEAGSPYVYTGPQFSTVACTSLLCCIQKQCDADTFAAINDSGLVYDGGVVVDEVGTVPRNNRIQIPPSH